MTTSSNQLTLVEQIVTAYERTGWTIYEFRDRLAAAGFPIDRTTLKKKMVGKVGFSPTQLEIFAGVLGTTLAWVPQRSRARAA